MSQRADIKTFATGLLVIGSVLALFALQQAPHVIRGDYSRRLVWQSVSPDQKFRLEVRARASFPAFDILDSPGTAYFTVMDAQRGHVAASAEVPLLELFDFLRPRVRWTSTEVEVLKYDESQPEAVVRLQLAQ